MTPTALLIANSTDADAGYVGERLTQRGYLLRTLFRDSGEVPVTVAEAGDVDLLVLLGSEWSVHSPVEPDVLEAECTLTRSASEAGVPVLGLCYGAQVITQAFGGRVTLAAAPEIGFVHVESDDEALVPAGPWLEFHVDVVDAPPGAEVVARNGCGQQAFVLPGVLAVQFHPEVRPGTVADWARRFPDLVDYAGLDPGELVAEAEARVPESRASAHRLVDAFLDRFARQKIGLEL